LRVKALCMKHVKLKEKRYGATVDIMCLKRLQLKPHSFNLQISLTGKDEANYEFMRKSKSDSCFVLLNSRFPDFHNAITAEEATR